MSVHKGRWLHLSVYGIWKEYYQMQGLLVLFNVKLNCKENPEILLHCEVTLNKV